MTTSQINEKQWKGFEVVETLVTCWVGVRNGAAAMENGIELSKIKKIKLSHDLAV